MKGLGSNYSEVLFSLVGSLACKGGLEDLDDNLDSPCGGLQISSKQLYITNQLIKSFKAHPFQSKSKQYSERYSYFFLEGLREVKEVERG